MTEKRTRNGVKSRRMEIYYQEKLDGKLGGLLNTGIANERDIIIIFFLSLVGVDKVFNSNYSGHTWQFKVLTSVGDRLRQHQCPPLGGRIAYERGPQTAGSEIPAAGGMP
jgi:hypothetical protein